RPVTKMYFVVCPRCAVGVMLGSSRSECGPIAIGALQVLLRVDARPSRLVHEGDADPDAGHQRPQLFEALDLLEGMLRQLGPSHERGAGVGINADVLMDLRP